VGSLGQGAAALRTAPAWRAVPSWAECPSRLWPVGVVESAAMVLWRIWLWKNAPRRGDARGDAHLAKVELAPEAIPLRSGGTTLTAAEATTG